MRTRKTNDFIIKLGGYSKKRNFNFIYYNIAFIAMLSRQQNGLLYLLGYGNLGMLQIMKSIDFKKSLTNPPGKPKLPLTTKPPQTQ